MSERSDAGYRGWSGSTADPTTLVLVRHGVTAHTAAKRFSGGLGGANPGLSADGEAQVRATSRWLSTWPVRPDVVVSSPVRRAQESAAILAVALDLPVTVEDAMAEMEFGAWDGLTFAEVEQLHPDDLQQWLGSMDVAAGGGESFCDVERRVLEGRDRILAEHAGRTVAVVSHVTPIKTLVAAALGAPLEAVYRMELSAASVTVIGYYDGGGASLRLFNGQPANDRPQDTTTSS